MKRGFDHFEVVGREELQCFREGISFLEIVLRLLPSCNCNHRLLVFLKENEETCFKLKRFDEV